MKYEKKLSQSVFNSLLTTSWIGILLFFSIGASNVQSQETGNTGAPLVYWKMEEGNGNVVVDSSGHGYDLRLVNPPSTPSWSTDVPPLTGGNTHSLAFDGVNDYAYAYPLIETSGDAQLTVESWIRFDGDFANQQTIASVWEEGSFQWALGTLGNEVTVYLANVGYSRGPNYTTVGSNLQANQWYHVAFVYDGSGATDMDRLKVFVDGTQYPLIFPGGISPTLTGAGAPVRLGRNFNGQLRGQLDEVRIYTVARSSTDIASDANGQVASTQPPPPPTPTPTPVPGNPVTYWKMEEGTGTTVVDSTGHGHDLFLTSNPSTPSWSTDVPPLTGGNTHSLAFDGVDDYAYAYPLIETSGDAQLTVESWIRFDGDFANQQTIASVWEEGSFQWALGTLGNEVTVYLANVGYSRGPNYTTVGSNLQANQWYHVAFVYDGSGATDMDRLKVFVDGTQYPLIFPGGISPTLTDAGIPIHLGRNFNGQLRGQLDEVRIYTVARSSTDIASDANGQTAAPLIAIQDSFLRSGNDNTNEGANPNLIIRSDGNNRALVTFELTGLSGPVGQANLRLYIIYNADNWGNTGRTIEAHHLLQSWTEGNGANLQPGNLTNAQFHPYEARGTGAGVTWKCAIDTNIYNQATDCNPKWDGGAFVAMPTAVVTIYKDFAGNKQLPPTTKTVGWISFNVTTDVNTCLTNHANQCGWLIKKTEEGQPGRVEFASKEGAIALYNSQFSQPVSPQLVLASSVNGASVLTANGSGQVQPNTLFLPLVER